jgi:hypothetical protein
MADPHGSASVSAHELLQWILGCDSRDEIHAVVSRWLRANPPPRSIEEILAHVDDMLAGLYKSEYDPRIVAPAVAELVSMAEQLVRDGDSESAQAWVDEFVHQPHPALGGRCPIHLLATPEGLAQAKRLLFAHAQS